ncbi:MAG TPA: ribosome maturation factor RimM [Rhizomicrobium sp.]
MARDILLAVVIGAQGLRGEVRVKTFAQTPDRLRAYGPLHANDGRIFEIASMRPLKSDIAVVHFEGVQTREAAESLRGVELHVSRDVLPAPEENEFYHADLIGLRAEDVQGRLIGEVRAIHNFGAGDVIEIARADGGNLFLPFTRDTVPAVEPETGRLVMVEPPDDEALKQGGVE